MNTLQTEYNKLGSEIQSLYFTRSSLIKEGKIDRFDDLEIERFTKRVRELEAKKKQVEDSLRRSLNGYSGFQSSVLVRDGDSGVDLGFEVERDALETGILAPQPKRRRRAIFNRARPEYS